MRLCKPSYEIYKQDPGLEGIYEAIEIAGRTCYRSQRPEGKTAKDFVDMLIKNKHCYTAGSMVLTEVGWIPWKDYKGEKVAVVNPSGSFRGFEIPSRVLKHEYSGKFYYYPSLGLKVTEGHRMYGLFRESKNDFYNSTSYNTFVCNQSYKDNNGREKTLGERMFKVPKHCTKPIHSNPFYELIGFWLGDGCYQPQTVNKLVFHLKKDRKIQYLKDLCEELGYSFKIGADNYYKVYHPNIGKDFNSLFYNKNGKTIPTMYMSSDPIAVKSIINGLINSDGSVGINTKTITYTSTSFDIIHWLLNTGSIGGFTVSNFKLYDWNDPKHNPIFKVFLLDTDYTINNDSRNPDSKVIITEETQEVYCVTVSTGLILVRGENGVTSICGNCAMLEHGTVYLKIPYKGDIIRSKYYQNPYSKVNHYSIGYAEGFICVSTNMRVLQENGWLDDLQYLCEPTEHHEKRITVKFITSIGIGRELLRHRVFSFANESTRYCNYSSEKRFGGEITFIIPTWAESLQEGVLEYSPFEITPKEISFMNSCYKDEKSYLEMIHYGATPQEAREVLPLATKSELIMTGFISDWKDVFNKRSSIAATGKPHPDMVALIDPLMQEFTNKNFIYNK